MTDTPDKDKLCFHCGMAGMLIEVSGEMMSMGWMAYDADGRVTACGLGKHSRTEPGSAATVKIVFGRTLFGKLLEATS